MIDINKCKKNTASAMTLTVKRKGDPSLIKVSVYYFSLIAASTLSMEMPAALATPSP